MDGDSDSLSECRALSPLRSPITHDISLRLNGSAHSFAAHQSLNSNRVDKIHQHHLTNGKLQTNKGSTSSNQTNGSCNNHQNLGSTSCSSSKINHDHSHNSFCDTNGSKEYTNGVETSNGCQGSPLRSQLGLKLKKSNAPATTQSRPSDACQVIRMYAIWFVNYF